jgi:uncharacterized repeat protein (TIGR03803 family)
MLHTNLICRSIVVWLVWCSLGAIALSAQTFEDLADLTGSDGSNPYSALVQGRDGNFYGTTERGGASNNGAIFKMTPEGAITVIYSFCSETNCIDGSEPQAGLVLGTNGNFYGVTSAGGENYFGQCGSGCGTVFKITPSGALTTLYTFCSETNCLDGQEPVGQLIQGTNGSFYGTTTGGGQLGIGTVFRITPAGLMFQLSSFCVQSSCTGSAGARPQAGLVEGNDGNFYGTTEDGGANGQGTVFKLTPAGKIETLYSFCSQPNCTDGAEPWDGLVQGSDGNFYGTTYGGGASSNGGGEVYKITPSGELTTLYSFCTQSNCSDGENPFGGLVQGSDGNFYGTTENVEDGYGTVFSVTPSGKLTILHEFDGTQGSYPSAQLIQGVNGAFYGTTSSGGADGYGTIFELSVGLKPLIEAVTNQGKVGNSIKFLGQGFTSSTTVSFNGTKSSKVKVLSGTYLTATVPDGAATGFVTATTSDGTLKSNQTFRVTPQITAFSPESGSAGTDVTIDGESLTGATSVAFGGIMATSFEVNSYTKITVTVPTGAKTGKITVTTPGGTATSAGTFTPD